jgi:hypothetical protein
MTTWRTDLKGSLPTSSGGVNYVTTEFVIERVFIEKVCERRLGFNGPNPPNGWRWDEAFLRQEENPETLPCPEIKRSILTGLPRNYWENGPIAGREGDSLAILGVEEIYEEGKPCWAPVIQTGDVNIWRDSQYLFSDDSVIENLPESPALSLDESGRSRYGLSRPLRVGSHISVCIYERQDGEVVPWRDYSLRGAFSSILDRAGDPQVTVDGTTIHWGLVDTTKREFITYLFEETTILHFNQYVPESIASLEDPASLLDFYSKEFIGYADGTKNLVLYSRFFPFEEGSVRVWSVDLSGDAFVELPIVEAFSGPTGVKIDYDIGGVIFGDGILGEKLPFGRQVYIGYKATARIEYEEEDFGDEVVALSANVSPLASSLNRGFVVITRTEDDIGSLLLETNKTSFVIGGVRYDGAVSLGADFASLVATATDPKGYPIPDLQVYFFMRSSIIGSIGGVGSVVSKRTLPNGKAKTFYSPPISPETLGQYVKTVIGGDTLSVTGGTFSSADDIYTYRVLKDDPFLGKVGADTEAGEVPWDNDPPNGRKVVIYEWDATVINPVTGATGAFRPTRPISFTTNSLTYGIALESPDLSTAPGSDNLGAYWVVCDRVLTIAARAWSRKRRAWVFSNDLIFRLSIPEYMKGSYLSPTLGEIPFGWRLPDGSYEVAGTLDGATYITINPVAGPHPIVDVIDGDTMNWAAFWPGGGTAYGDHVPAPFAFLPLSYTVTI